MIASILFGLIVVVAFAALQTYKPGRSSVPSARSSAGISRRRSTSSSRC